MGTLHRRNWKGWVPNNDENGSPEGLLRADNLITDKQGSIRLTRGTARKSSGAFGSAVNALYSKTITGQKLRYVSYNGTVARNYSGGSPTEVDFSSPILTGGAADYAAFGSAWGHNFIFSETKKRADKGLEASWRDLGIAAPAAPVVTVKAPPDCSITDATKFDLGGPWTHSATPGTDWVTAEGTEGSIGASWYSVIVDPATFRGIAQVPANSVAATWDSTEFSSPGYDTPNDLFNMEIRLGDTNLVKKVRVEFFLETPAGVGTTVDVKNYFWHEWNSDQAVDNTIDYFNPDVYAYTDSIEFINKVQADLIPGVTLSNFFREGQNFWGTLQARRGKFGRVGTDDALGWNTVKGIRVSVSYKDVDPTTGTIDFYIGVLQFLGGAQGQLSGFYSYIEVDINDTGEYVEMGIASPASSEVQVFNANTEITCHAVAANANKKWIFRSSTQTPGYYFVKELTANFTTPFTDTLSDIDALRNPSLEVYRTALPSGIRYVVGSYYDRLLYFDYRTLYPSYRYDAGSYDGRHAMDIAAGDNEIIMWVVKIIDGEVLVGTTSDIYALRGNFSFDEATGLLDVSVQALGIEQVPVSYAVAVSGTTVIYQAEDGWRTIEGSTTRSITGDLQLLYQTTACHGINPVIKGSRNSSTSFATVSGNRLICSVDHSTDGRALHVLDLEKGVWRYWRDIESPNDNPLVIITEEDGVVLFSTTATGDKFLYQWDTGSTIGNARIPRFVFRTTYDNDGKPNNRKDLLVLRVLADTNNADATLTLRGYNHTNTLTTVNYTLNCNGIQERFIDISAFAIAPKRIQIEINGTLSSSFTLVEFSIEYQERPEQTNYLRLPPSNLGAAGRKRIPALNYVIDTLGNTVTFTPILDNVPQTPSTVTKTEKSTVTHAFASDKTAYDVEGMLYTNTGVFEFYELLNSKEIEVLPDPLAYKFINTHNFGTTKRKRFLQVGLQIDTGGANVLYTPIVDGVAQPTLTLNTNRKATIIYYFTSETIGIELAGTLESSSLFEFYGYSIEDCIIEVLPPAGKFIRIPYTNFGSTSRKRFIQLGLVIDTKGQNVVYIPIIDGVSQPLQVLNTSYKKTVIYVFPINTEGIDVGGTLQSNTEFEFYTVSNEDSIWEKLPPVSQYIKLQTSNFGNASKKRVRTWPIVMNTRGGTVIFTPEVDGVLTAPSYFTSTDKRTLLHYFDTDVFGIDYGGTLQGTSDFEFYQALQPTLVEILPVGKVFDQLGPFHFLRKGKVRQINLRLLPEGDTINYKIYSNDDMLFSGSKSVVSGKEQAIEIKLPKGVNVELMRIELTSTSVFHRMNAELKVDQTGQGTEWNWVKI